jgi:hypothetical protein
MRSIIMSNCIILLVEITLRTIYITFCVRDPLAVTMENQLQ